MTHTLSGNSTVVPAADQVSSELGDEVVILNLKAGVYYGLTSVGAHIWSLLPGGRTVNELRDAVLAEYDVEPERCERELMALLEKLAQQGLIEVNDASGP